MFELSGCALQMPYIDDLVVWTPKATGGKLIANAEPKVVVSVEDISSMHIYDNKSLQKIRVNPAHVTILPLLDP